MLTGIHFLLTYTCNWKCDHCFLYGSPTAKGTFTLDQIRAVLQELVKIGTIELVYFEGGEPFLFYPLMLEGIRRARDLGFKTGIVTNSYWATCREDAELWLRPLRDLELSALRVSDDSFHGGEEENNPAKNALSAAEKLGVPAKVLCTEKPVVETRGADGASIVTGGAMLKGRAAEKLAEGLPKRPCQEFTECDEEDLRDPRRVHVDAYGYVHLCQGLVMGNMWETPLAKLVKDYDPDAHPICGPLLQGGPAHLAEVYNVPHDEAYATACHFCYMVRRALVDRFPQYLAPRQVYGLE